MKITSSTPQKQSKLIQNHLQFIVYPSPSPILHNQTISFLPLHVTLSSTIISQKAIAIPTQAMQHASKLLNHSLSFVYNLPSHSFAPLPQNITREKGNKPLVYWPKMQLPWTIPEQRKNVISKRCLIARCAGIIRYGCFVLCGECVTWSMSLPSIHAFGRLLLHLHLLLGFFSSFISLAHKQNSPPSISPVAQPARSQSPS